MARNLPPGPRSRGSFKAFNQDRLRFLLEMAQYGDVSMTKFGPYPVFIANAPDAIHQVLVSDAARYQKSRVTKNVMKPIIGNGLFINDGEAWKRQRRLSQPAFHTRRIGAYADVMVEYTAQAANQWRTGQVLELDREMASLTMRIIGKTMFDADVQGDSREVGSAVSKLLTVMMDRFSKLYAVPMWLPIPSNRALKQSVGTLDELLLGIIEERRASGEDKGDLLSMLLLAQDDEGTGSMSDEQVRDEAITFFGAGHETTAVTLMWTFYLLSQYPKIAARVYDEVDAVLGDRLAALHNVPSLTYTEQVIKEAMRLYPPAWTTTRTAIETTTLQGYEVNPGETVMINIYGAHRDPRWFPQPERFDPDRFSPEREKDLPKYAYLPFGGGPRVCIGNAFAMMEAKLVLATIAQRCRLELAPGETVAPDTMFTLRPRGGIRMVACERELTPLGADALYA